MERKKLFSIHGRRKTCLVFSLVHHTLLSKRPRHIAMIHCINSHLFLFVFLYVVIERMEMIH